MKSDIQLKDIMQKADRANELLNDPLIQEFIISMRGDLLNKFESTELVDENERMNAWQQAQVLNSFLSKFTKTIRDGKNANLTLIERAKKLIKRVV